MSILFIIVAILPIVLIGLFIYKKDKFKEPSNLLFKLFIFGAISCLPAVILELIMSSFFPEMEYMNFFEMFLYAFLVIALVEEVCKWGFLYKIAYIHDEFDSLYDMIVYASFVALGFACFENILYVYSNGILTGLVRAVTAVPGHVCDGILMGFYLSLAKINQIRGNNTLTKRFKIYSLVIPIIAHGIYDFCLFCGSPIFIFIFAVSIVTIFIICFRKVKEVSSKDMIFKYRNNYCTNCGLRVTSRFCTRCGKENK